MTLISSIKNLFRRGGAKLGVVKSLGQITDDDRVAISPNEYERIAVAKKYYADDLEKIHYKNSYGQDCKRALSSINVTKMAARRLASIIFNEQCSVQINNKAAQDLFDQIAHDEEFYTTLEEYLEKWIAFGSGAIRPYVDGNKIKLAWVVADQFYPLQSNTSEVNEACIASKTVRSENNKQAYYTLLEFHQWLNNGDYQITNELYRSESADNVGDQVPLDMLDEYAGLEPQVTLSGLKEPLFTFFKTPGANNQTLESPLGLGLIDNSKNVVDAINRTHDQFVWEIKMGKRRVAVPAEMLRSGGQFAGNGEQTHPPMFDTEQNVYEAMYGDPNSLKITDLTTNIRNDQFEKSMEFFVSEFENEVGLSQGTFTATPEGLKTATEVVSNNSMTYQTRSSYLTQVDKTIRGLVKSILELAQASNLFEDGRPLWSGDIDSIDITVDFNDGVYVDKEAQFTKDLQMVESKMMPKYLFIERNLGYDEDKAKALIEEVEAETPEPPVNQEVGAFGFGGGAGDGEEDTDTDDDQETS